MLQEIFYVTSIVLSVVFIVVLLTVLYVVVTIYRRLNEMLDVAKDRAGQVGDLIDAFGERGQDLLHLMSSEGQKAVSASSLLALLMNGYFFTRMLFGKKHRRS